MAPTAWGAITAKAYRCNWKSRTSGNYPAVEKPGAWRPWKSLRDFHFPMAPPPHQSLPPKPKPDISCATKTGHFNLLTTLAGRGKPAGLWAAANWAREWLLR